MNYHTLNRDFSERLCEVTDAEPYCKAADNFTAYLKEKPSLRPFKPAPSPAVAGHGVRFHFTLSKVGRVSSPLLAILRDRFPCCRKSFIKLSLIRQR